MKALTVQREPAELTSFFMDESHELEKLATLLIDEPPGTLITFREESARDIRYSLVVGTEDGRLLFKLARIFGCSTQHLPSVKDKSFEAGDDWHGQGDIDLRELADEFTATRGEFFDFDIAVSQLRALAVRLT